jgi:hypothetical protein
MSNEQALGGNTKHRQSLEAVVVKSCPHCGAPGVWVAPKNVAEAKHYMGWPGCIVATEDPRSGKPVGEFCPNCNGRRVGLVKVLGEIWHRIFT